MALLCGPGGDLNYLLMRKSRTLKTTIPRMTSSGMNAYKIRKFAVNLDVAPGQVLSMKWIPWVTEHIGWFVVELLEPPAKETDRQSALMHFITNLSLMFRTCSALKVAFLVKDTRYFSEPRVHSEMKQGWVWGPGLFWRWKSIWLSLENRYIPLFLVVTYQQTP